MEHEPSRTLVVQQLLEEVLTVALVQLLAHVGLGLNSGLEAP